VTTVNNVDDGRKRRAVRNAVLLAALAVAIYVGFILLNVLSKK
jgi:hypothetical protein